MSENTLPLGIMRQAMMKLDSFITDMRESAEDEDISCKNKELFGYLAEEAGNILAVLTNMVMQEMGKDDFLDERLEPDAIDLFPGT